jgi:hypothetical protein
MIGLKQLVKSNQETAATVNNCCSTSFFELPHKLPNIAIFF